MQPYLQYIILLGAVVIVGGLVMPRKKQEVVTRPKSMENMENALEQFMENMEKDNEELVLLVKNAQEESKSDAVRKEQRIAQLEARCEQLTEQLQDTLTKVSKSGSLSAIEYAQHTSSDSNQTQFPVPSQQEAMHILDAQVEAETDKQSIQSRYKDLFSLYEQGKSIEIISKKLGMNKGEVQLIIQLSKQEEASRA
ncbi:vacuolar-type H+-ATPase subunit I/STV1 [Paenibacillus endophyticus]|uniref:Vacuolar-type H+-ATPase subunit I/STV1 n=1 Tax=Paenibacillus endophyticus TaxID=1294268 RepID=A0A7W5G9V9_9BACL|nr:hypothetical protein [Paenibacillus endophyticus]MBB3152081.1 vacuolar-type H+-ATPase subunit I/STV1 [Paenibacillus endophyticus]